MIRVATSKAFSITFTVFVVSASLECLFVVPRLSHESTSLLKNFLKSLTAMSYSSSLLPEVEHSSSLDSFLAFKARDFLLTFSLTISKSLYYDDSFVKLEVPMSSSRDSDVKSFALQSS
ncbi:hypothetical protein Tco_1268022 [Tanacetum coccineum]